MGVTVDVAVNLQLVTHGEYKFQHQLRPQPEAQNGNGKSAEPGRIVPQTSSVIAPGLARRLPA